MAKCKFRAFYVPFFVPFFLSIVRKNDKFQLKKHIKIQQKIHFIVENCHFLGQKKGHKMP